MLKLKLYENQSWKTKISVVKTVIFEILIFFNLFIKINGSSLSINLIKSTYC